MDDRSPDPEVSAEREADDSTTPVVQEEPKDSTEEDREIELEARIEQIVMERYSGPFPHPEHLERFAALYPRAPEIIFSTFEDQSAHRREIESKYLDETEKRADRGQLLAYSLVLAAILCGFVAILVGEAGVGGSIIGVAFTGGVVLYIAGGNAKSRPAARPVGSNSRDKASASQGQAIQKAAS